MDIRSTQDEATKSISPEPNSLLPPTEPKCELREALGYSSQNRNLGLRRSNSAAQRRLPQNNLSIVEETSNHINEGRDNDIKASFPPQRLQSKGIILDGLAKPASREGRQFTVGNVGQNGKIYLRPIPNPNQPFHTRGLSQPPHTLGDSMSLRPIPHEEDGRHSFWSNSQYSEFGPLNSRNSRLESNLLGRDNMPGPGHHTSHLSRRHSLSTISDEFHGSAARIRGEFRIVIERPENDEVKPVGKPEVPSLTIPIPHYRLGGFRFTSGGTPVLRSSAYTRTSVSDNYRSSALMRSDGSEGPAFPSRILSGTSSSYAPPLFPSPRSLDSSSVSPPQSGVFYKLREPIDPFVFDDLLPIMDDPSVVRYAKDSQQVTAATPARIVAQISSDSFMDYELVSDFFLTFRSYLSHSNLLSLLMARLEWAVNRLEDDGRIIRIRAFAALRHWILNYFVDDFLPLRHLRVLFCDRLNQMYDKVKCRNRDGNSDLKILIDLKKCWNGRCCLYWETPASVDGNDVDTPVQPGGFEGNAPVDTLAEEKGNEEYFNSMLAMCEQPVFSFQQWSPSAEPSDSRGPRTSPRPPDEKKESPVSPGSIEATSCFIPHIMPRRNSDQSPRANAPHPVLLASPKLTSPVTPSQFAFPSMPPPWRRPMHAHKRSGSFSDSVRDDRAPLPLSSFDTHGQLLYQTSSHTGNMIRGNVYGPPEPHLASLGPPSPTFETPPVEFGGQDFESSSKPPSPSMKTFLGTLRRALYNRPIAQPSTAREVNAYEVRGKTSPLPRNISCHPDRSRGKFGTHPRTHTRVDLLCEEAFLSYQKLLKGSDQSQTSVDKGSAPSDGGKQPPTSSDGPSKAERRHDSIPSQLTRGSKSIVIVDDTRTGGPVLMSGGLAASLREMPYTAPGPADRESLQNLGFSPLEAPEEIRPHDGDLLNTILEPKTHLPVRDMSILHYNSGYSVEKPIRELRKYASHDSVITKHTPLSDSQRISRTGMPSMTRAPMLRRRPGGDLRKMQHGLEAIPKHLTMSTDNLTESSSVTGSMVQMADKARFNNGLSNLAKSRHRCTLDESRNIRRTFEKAVAGFAKIPDDEDGGIESALLKLEGKWEGKSPTHHSAPKTQADDQHLHAPNTLDYGLHQTDGRASKFSRAHSTSYAGSEGSYCSIPLLERGLADDSIKSPQAYDTALQQHDDNVEEAVAAETEPSLSIEMVEKTESMQQVQTSTEPEAPPEHRTLDDEAEAENYASDISSEISIDVIDRAEGAGLSAEKGHVTSPILSFASLGVPTHPLADPPSPPATLGYQGPRTSDSCPNGIRDQPITPDFSPARSSGRLEQVRARSEKLRLNLDAQLPRSPTGSFSNPGHTPFILAYDSELLARQFAIVEQAALSEVDWKDLVDMKWSHSSQSTLNWVTYLADQERKGIDMVVARFNLMVKWALSEILMTTNQFQRANTITKLIHVAVYSRRIRNYATMLQLTIALCSVDCSRLLKTWELVPEREKHLLKEIEQLIQPTRNFHCLRSEMETCNLQEGCIPFVGLYVQDLTYNAQKPAQIAGTRDGEPLVNFERYRTAASIVKSLLRLIDASTKYKFEPIYGLVERCLWIAALSDEKIVASSKELE